MRLLGYTESARILRNPATKILNGVTHHPFTGSCLDPPGVAMLPSIGVRETEFKSMPKEPNKNWQPPFLMGEKLRWWAHATAETVTGTKLRAPRSAETAVELVREIHNGALNFPGTYGIVFPAGPE